MHADLTPVSSTTVAAWGSVQNPANSAMARMFVEFLNGKIYEYVVPHAEVGGMQAASSKGTFINTLKKSFKGILTSVADVSSAFATSPRTKSKRTSPGKRSLVLSAREKLVFARFL